MTITIDLKQFRKQFASSAEAVPSRTNRDVLKSVLLVSTGTTIEMAASDGEQHIKSVIQYDGEPETILIPAALMRQVLNELTDETLTLSIDDTELTVKSGSTVFRLQTGDANDFPTVPSFNAQAYHEMDAAVLKSMIRKTIFAVDNDSTRYALGGIQIELFADKIVMAATDSRRLSVIEGACQAVENPSIDINRNVVPSDAMRLLDKTLSDGGLVKIAFTKTGVSFMVGDVSISSQLVQGRFPNYEAVLPKESQFTRRLTLVVQPFARLLSAVRVMESAESKGVTLTISNGTMAAKSTTSEIGEAKAEMPIAFDGEPVKIHVSGQYLSELCKACDPGQQLDVGIIGSDDRIVFSVDGLRHVIMPLSRDEPEAESAKKAEKSKKEKATA